MKPRRTHATYTEFVVSQELAWPVLPARPDMATAFRSTILNILTPSGGSMI